MSELVISVLLSTNKASKRLKFYFKKAVMEIIVYQESDKLYKCHMCYELSMTT